MAFYRTGTTLLVLLSFLPFGCGPATPSGPPRPVLFIGNSYTYVNDLPQIFTQLAASGGYRVVPTMVAPGGWTLAQHANAPDTLKAIESQKWETVVLQDQSVAPAIKEERENEMFPSVRYLAHLIQRQGATPVLYMTWGRKNGLPENGWVDCDAMQDQLTLAYDGIAKELRIPVARVGEAWRRVHHDRPSLELWNPDGSHPSLAGTYLAACVLYRVIFQKSPEGLSFHSTLDREDAAYLQKAAATTPAAPSLAL